MNPKLRFKRADGTDYPDWEEKKLGDICNINPQTEKLDDKFIYIDLGCIEQGEMLTKNIITKTKAPSRAKRVLSKNDVLFQSVRPHNLGHFHYKNIFDIQAVASTGFFQLRMINGLNSFLYQVLYTENFNKEVDVRCVGSNYPAINSSSFSEIVISLPCLEEQKKIGSFLSDIDEVILASDQEVKKLQELKKGAMQKIFSQEVRFKRDDGTDYPDWKNDILENICSIVDYRGKTPKKVKSGIFLVTAKNIRMGFIDYECSKEYILPSDYEEVMHRGKVKIGDVLITTEAPFGNVAQIDRTDIALAQRVIKYSAKIENLNNTYLKYYLMSENFQNILDILSTGGTVKGIKGSLLHKQSVSLPCLEEQQKIGDFLSDFDEAISLAKQELEKWKLLKKGLLQQMFV